MSSGHTASAVELLNAGLLAEEHHEAPISDRTSPRPPGRAARAARYADACNLPPSPEIPRQLDQPRRLREREDRDYDAIERTVPFGFDVGAGGSKVGELLGQLRWLAGLGIETVFGWVVGVDQLTPLEVMGREVIPAVADL